MTACAPVTTLARNDATTTKTTTAPDFRYVTFFVLQGDSSGSPTVDRQRKNDIAMELNSKGFIATAPEEAEAVVVVHTATAAKRSREALYEGWGGWGWRLADSHLSIRTDDYATGMIVTNGEPQYLPFNGTSLLYVSYTTSSGFREPTDQELYVRIPAGWFHAWTANGLWEQVRVDELPVDLAKIGA